MRHHPIDTQAPLLVQRLPRCSRAVLCIALLLGLLPASAQIVPYYPPEVWFGVIGYTNNLPGESPDTYTPFSSVRFSYHRQFLSYGKFTNTLLTYGSYERYLNATRSRNYHPLSLNPILTTYYAANDILTLGVELDGQLRSIPGAHDDGEVFAVYDRHIRATPFHCLVAHPNVIVGERLTYVRCSVTDRTWYYVGEFLTDFDMLRYEAPVTVLTPLHLRLLLRPYLYDIRYREIPARGPDGDIAEGNPLLHENGIGMALGLKYYHYRLGTPELAVELERNNDRVYGCNDYTKFRVRAAWENQYFTSLFGYKLAYQYTRIDAATSVVGFDDTDNSLGELWQNEHLLDLILILNINRNVSVRPEYDMRYQLLPKRDPHVKHRFWLNIHIIV